MIVFFACHTCRTSAMVEVDNLARQMEKNPHLVRIFACKQCDRVIGIIGSEKVPGGATLVDSFGVPVSEIAARKPIRDTFVIYIGRGQPLELSYGKPPALLQSKPPNKMVVQWTEGEPSTGHPTLSGTQSWCLGKGGKGTGCHGMSPDGCYTCTQAGDKRPSKYSGDA